MKKLLLIAASLLILIPSIARAQTTTNTLQWDIPVPLATYNTYSVEVKLDGAVQKPATCTALNTTTTTCSLTVPALTTGSHTLSIANTLNQQTATLVVTGADPTNAPKPAQNFRINITITITSGT